MGAIGNFQCFEAGHPVPDENSFRGTQAALDLVADLTEQDTVLFLLSGGGSALFEKPLVSGEVLQDITSQLLACGADIVEINTIRKRLSGVKGGRFALACAPAKVFSIVLSDKVMKEQERLSELQDARTEIQSEIAELQQAHQGNRETGQNQRAHPKAET